MTRIAILIGASPQGDELLGVRWDVQAWSSFLLSNLGGAWKNEEIIDASSLNKIELISLMQESTEADYTFVMFAGHGATVTSDLPWNELQLTLESGELILERELNPGCARFTLFLDSCRTHEVLIEHQKMASFREYIDRVKVRCAFDTKLMQAEKGMIKVYSTSYNTMAADKDSFSQHIIYAAGQWAKENQGTLDFAEATVLGAVSLNILNPQQKPEYLGGRRMHHFPFAVSL